MNLVCAKCGRPVNVRERDVREVGASIEPRSFEDSYLYGRHLACPFCVVERGGMYRLERPAHGDAA